MRTSHVFAGAAGVVLLLGAGVAGADVISFEELGQQPCVFSSTQPLTNEYNNIGLTFAGPNQGEGGAILDQCSNFGINAHSEPNFLAFNTGTYARWPETVTFDGGTGHVQLYASAGSQAGDIRMTAYDAGNNVVDSTTVPLPASQWTLAEVSGDISYIIFGGSSNTWMLIDDMTYEAGGYRLTINGVCPGRVTVSWTGGTPGRSHGLVFGQNLGTTTIPQNQPCSGTVLGIAGQVRLVDPPGIFDNQGGAGSISGNAGSSACGGYLQAVEGGTCQTSNPAQIP